MSRKSKKVIENSEIVADEVKESIGPTYEVVEDKARHVEMKIKVIKKGVNVSNPDECIEANCPSTFGKYGCRPCVVWRNKQK